MKDETLRGPATAPVLIALSASFLVFVFYYLTAAPGAWWGDGLELAAAAKVLGIPHPTGYPLYMVLGHVAMRVFSFADPGRVLTMMSLVFCTLAGLYLGLACSRFSIRELRDDERPPIISLSLIVFAGMALFGFSSTVWEHATFAEVYPLTWLFIAGILLIVVSGEEVPGFGRVAALGGVCGLSLLNHYSIVAFAPLALFAVIEWGRRSRKLAAYLGLFISVTLICLIGYLYFPLRASANPPINWGDPRTLSGLLWMMRGGDYVSMNAPESASALLQGWGYWINWWRRQFASEYFFSTRSLPAVILALAVGPTILAAGVAGCVRIFRRDWALGAGLLAAILITLLFSILYRIPDRDAYLVPALPAVIIGLVEWGKVLSSKFQVKYANRWAAKYWPVLPLVLILTLIPLQLLRVGKSWDNGPDQWAENLLNNVPPDSIVLTRQAHDSEIYALWYEQIVNNTRPDVTVFGTGFIFSGWYQKYFEVEGRPDVPLFITDREPGAKEVFDIALIGGVIAPNAAKRRIFMPISNPQEMDPALRQLNPVPVAELLPEDYYERTAYKLNPPGRLLVELRPDENLLEQYREKFRALFGTDPPSN